MSERSRSSRWLPVLVSAAFLSGAAATGAAEFHVSGFTIDGGGNRSAGGAFTLGGSIGQPDAGWLSESTFTLLGGFWYGGDAVSGVGDEVAAVGPVELRLHQATPNPLSERTQVAFDLSRATVVHVAIFDVAGRLVRVLADGAFAAGRHERSWDRSDQSGSPVPAGVYFLRMAAGVDRKRQKLVVLH